MLKLEPRTNPSVLMSWMSPVFAVLLTVLCGVALFLSLGKNPLEGLEIFFWEPISNLQGWAGVGVKVTPLLLIAIGLAVCYRANVFNIGAEGQLVLGAITGGWVALH